MRPAVSKQLAATHDVDDYHQYHIMIHNDNDYHRFYDNDDYHQYHDNDYYHQTYHVDNDNDKNEIKRKVQFK